MLKLGLKLGDADTVTVGAALGCNDIVGNIVRSDEGKAVVAMLRPTLGLTLGEDDGVMLGLPLGCVPIVGLPVAVRIDEG